jgi:hypothetical protein
MDQLALFKPATFPQALMGSEYITLRPYLGIPERGPVEFLLKDNKEYINLEETTLTVKCKITNADGTPIKATSVSAHDDQVALVNNSMHSLFSDVEVQINEKRVEGGDNNYPYKSYIASVFRYSKETQEGQLFSVGFVRDDHANMDTVANTGYVKRKLWTNEGAVKEFKGKLNLSILNQQRFLIPGADIYFKFERAKDVFCIFNNVSTLKPKVVIKAMELQLMPVKVHPEVVAQHAHALSSGLPALYPIQRVEIENMICRKDSMGETKEFLFHGKIPKYIVMLMVANTAMNGDYSKNPFNFKPFNVSYVHLTRDRANVPFPPFEPNFNNNSVLQEYLSLFQSNGVLGKNTVLPISYDEFKSGYTNFQWNLTDDGKGSNSMADPRGNLKIEVKFSEALAESVNVLLYGIMDSNVLVYLDDVVEVDYNA